MIGPNINARDHISKANPKTIDFYGSFSNSCQVHWPTASVERCSLNCRSTYPPAASCKQARERIQDLTLAATQRRHTLSCSATGIAPGLYCVSFSLTVRCETRRGLPRSPPLGTLRVFFGFFPEPSLSIMTKAPAAARAAAKPPPIIAYDVVFSLGCWPRTVQLQARVVLT